MNDTRFLAALNDALGACGLDLSAPAARSDPAAVEAWARFLSACVERGVSIADPRWGRLEVRTGAEGTRLALPAPGARSDEGDSQDFRVGLSLLMSLLGGRPPGE